jgi:hypothetical protein
MSKRNLASITLEKAHFFADHARAAGPAQREDFSKFFEAAIIFARSTTLHLQKEYSQRSGFKDWYSGKQDMMRHDPVCSFFLKRRNFILKEGPVSLHKAASVTIRESLMLSGSVEVKVIRGKPWYRRSPKILWGDLRVIIMKPILRWLKKRETKRRRLDSQEKPKVETTEDFVFDDPKWRDHPALDILSEYLGKLKLIVNEAETRFSDRKTPKY